MSTGIHEQAQLVRMAWLKELQMSNGLSPLAVIAACCFVLGDVAQLHGVKRNDVVETLKEVWMLVEKERKELPPPSLIMRPT